jgi:hypothetical protein
VTGPGISCPGDCSQVYADGTSVTLSASFAGGSSFGGWSGACSGTGACQLTMSADKAVGAAFQLDPQPLPLPSPAPSGGPLSTWRQANSYESASDFSLLSPGEWVDNTWRTAAGFDVARTSERGGVEGAGHYAVKVTDNGGAHDDCACPRMKFEDGHAYGAGDEVWIEGSWLIPDPSKIGWSRLMNLSHWTPDGATNNTNWIAGLVIREPGTMQVTARSYNSDDWITTFYGPVAIPRNRWFTVDLHFKLSTADGQALTEVYLDGERVAASTKRNMFSPAPLTIYQGGAPHLYGPNGPSAAGTTIYFDLPRIAP